MEIRDILEEVYKGLIAVDEAHDIFDEILASDETDSVFDLLGFSLTESSAYCHGADFDDVAKWRYEGWPDSCAVCGKKIVPEEGGWWAKGKGDTFYLVHIKDCLEKIDAGHARFLRGEE